MTLTVNMKRDGWAHADAVPLIEVQSKLDDGWLIDGSTPTYTLQVPLATWKAKMNELTGGWRYEVNGHPYDVLDASIDNRATVTVSNPSLYADVQALVDSGWEIV